MHPLPEKELRAYHLFRRCQLRYSGMNFICQPSTVQRRIRHQLNRAIRVMVAMRRQVAP